jgi:L-threonylcarbamoyladenylate synthase
MSRLLSANEESWELAAAALRRGDLVVFPTDTVYGVGCNPYDVSALDKIYIAKGRPQSKAIPLLLAGTSILSAVAGRLTRQAEVLGQRFWPGALTLVIERKDDLPPQLGTGNTIAVRVPAHLELRSLLADCGGALAVTSANRSGEPDALSVQEAFSYLGQSVAIYIDGGSSGGSRPSTVVDCSGESIRLLREGAISAAEIQRALEGTAG